MTHIRSRFAAVVGSFVLALGAVSAARAQNLDASLSQSSTFANVGDSVTVVLTVTNTAAVGTNVFVQAWTTANATIGAPTPAASAGMPGTGASVSFTWVATVTAPGVVTITATASSDSGSDNQPVASVAVATPTILQTSLSLPVSLSITTGGKAVLTVSNTGGVPATNVVPQINVTGPAVATAPTPLSVAAIAGGASASFTWTVSPTAAGTIAVTANATADGPLSTALKTGSITNPAAGLTGSLTCKGTATVGQPLLYVLNVTNTGGVSPATVKAGLWSTTTSTTVSGPNPASVSSPLPGSKITFTWTVTMLAPLGSLAFTATACGDGVTFTAPSVANTTVLSPAIVSATLTVLSGTVTGSAFMVVLNASNAGQATAYITATNFVPSVSKTTANPIKGPNFTNVNVFPGVPVNLTWTVTAGVAGTNIVLTTTIFVTDANGGATTTVYAISSNKFNIVSFGKLTTRLCVNQSVAPGQPVQFVLSVSNTGGTTITGVTANFWTDGNAQVDAVSSPASIATLAPGGYGSFTWNAVPASQGRMNFYAVAQGFSLSITGSAVVAAAQAGASIGILTPDTKVTYLYPSPAHDSANIAYTMDESGSVAIRIYNASGRLVETLGDTQPAGVWSSAVTTSKFAPGVYFYILKWTYDSGRTVTSDVRKFAVVH